MRRVPLAERFWKKVSRSDGCWLWTGAILRNGYGYVGAGGSDGGNILAHRASWMLSNGPIPDGLCVLHHCDVRRCVRPDHLFLGTHVDNMQDMIAKGRTGDTRNLGSRNGRTHLTEDQVAEMRRRYAAGEATQWELAREYGIWQGTLSAIVRRAFWKHVR